MKKYLLMTLLVLAACTSAPPKHEAQQTNLIRNPRNFKELVQYQVQHSQKRIRNCYDFALTEQPNLKGKVVVGWDIDSGQVANPNVISSSLNNEKVESCILDVIRDMKFKNAPKDQVVSVSFPFVFSVASRTN